MADISTQTAMPNHDTTLHRCLNTGDQDYQRLRLKRERAKAERARLARPEALATPEPFDNLSNRMRIA
jgi:hypothetical protein